jgi:hypothetical protein
MARGSTGSARKAALRRSRPGSSRARVTCLTAPRVEIEGVPDSGLGHLSRPGTSRRLRTRVLRLTARIR